jgi:hypothetical protein
MGKRSKFPRIVKDAYSTPGKAVAPLLGYLSPHTRFIEPCAGAGHLVGHLEAAGHVCVGAYDLPIDARTSRYAEVERGVVFITNPPWLPSILHPIIANLADQASAWLLIYVDWLFTRQAIPFLPRLNAVIAIGRVTWMPGTKQNGMDNCVCALFDRPRPGGTTIRFVGHGGRTADSDSFPRRAA